MAAIDDLEDGFSRVEGLITFHRTLTTRQGRPPRHASDMLRATVVMAVATLDAFIRDLILELMPRVIVARNVSNEALVKYLDSDGGLRQIASASNPHRKRLELLRSRLERASAQAPEAIDRLVGLTTRNTDDMWRAIEIAVAPLMDSGKGKQSVKARLGRVVARRHQIAHRNDVPNDRKKAEPIRRSWVESEAEFLLELGRALDADLRLHVPRRKTRRRRARRNTSAA